MLSNYNFYIANVSYIVIFTYYKKEINC